MNHWILYLLVIASLISCKEKDTQYDVQKESTAEMNHPGREYLATYCYVCHNPSATMDNRIAPPMAGVKMHYINENTTKEEFIADLKKWLKEPSQDNSKMPGAIQKFGLMPFTPYPEEIIEQIGDYIYEYDVEAPVGFQNHHNNGMQMRMRQGMGMKNYQMMGQEMALTTKAELGKNLMLAIKKNGTLGALEFCNIKAIPLTDSMATVHTAHIKRVSDKNRNPLNKANEQELQAINYFKSRIAEGNEYAPITDTIGESIHFYAPILTSTMCLQCHGNLNENISPETHKKLLLLYPDDKATGYSENEVRGIWSIAFDKNN